MELKQAEHSRPLAKHQETTSTLETALHEVERPHNLGRRHLDARDAILAASTLGKICVDLIRAQHQGRMRHHLTQTHQLNQNMAECLELRSTRCAAKVAERPNHAAVHRRVDVLLDIAQRNIVHNRCQHGKRQRILAARTEMTGAKQLQLDHRIRTTLLLRT